jgi:hypothetical protein
VLVTYYRTYGNFHHSGKTYGYDFVLLERPSSWSTLVLHGLDPGLDWASCWLSFPSIFLVWSGPPSILLFVPTDQVLHSTPSLLTGQLPTSVQVNNMAAQHDTYTDTRIYITSILLFFLFTLLPLPLAGWLAQTLRIWHKYASQRLECLNHIFLSIWRFKKFNQQNKIS